MRAPSPGCERWRTSCHFCKDDYCERVLALEEPARCEVTAILRRNQEA